MTTRPIPLVCLFALVAACGPTTGTDAPDGDSSSTTDDDDTTTTTSDPATTTIATSDDVTSTTTPAESSTSTESSSDDGIADSGESGGTAMNDGHFNLVGQDAVQMPEGCAGEGDGPDEAWSIEFTLPANGTEFTMREGFGPYVTQYDCTLAELAFSCAHVNEVDYSRLSGTDAVVTLASSYELAWEGEQLVGTYEADFACTGSECAMVLSQWHVAAFPCGLQVPVVATPSPGQ